jgi:hypothetical protein
MKFSEEYLEELKVKRVNKFWKEYYKKLGEK